jgi:hypothetical protein
MPVRVLQTLLPMRGFQQKYSYSFPKPLSFTATKTPMLLPRGSDSNLEFENLNFIRIFIIKTQAAGEFKSGQQVSSGIR